MRISDWSSDVCSSDLGLTMAEARHELAFIATGLYGKPIMKQNGAPLRLTAPWKYGFKHIKSIVRFEFTDQRPTSFWTAIQGRSEERRVGKAWVSTVRSRWAPSD